MKRGVLELRFAATECRRCGGTRLLKQPCPDCGQVPEPHEVQPDIDRRRALIDAFRAGRRAAETPAIKAADATQQFVRAEHEVLHQLSRAAKSGRDATGLVRAFSELDDVVEALELPRPRPHRNIGRAHGRAAHAVRDGLELFVEALTAPSIVAAQDLERRGQRLLDSGAKILNDARAESELWDAAYDMPLQDVAAAIGLSARDAAGADGLSVADLDARLQQIYGRSADARPGLGIELHVIRGVLVGALDLEESAAVAGEAERLFLESEGLAALLGSPSWIAEQNRGMALMSAALFGLATMRDDASDLERIDQLLNVLIKCRESMVPHFLATIASPDVATYDRLRASRSGKVIDGAARRHPGLRLEEHLDVRLRHAGAHVAFDVEDGQVRLKYGTHGDVVLPADEVVDAVLSHVELVLSLYLGLSGAASSLDLGLAPSTHASARDQAAGLEVAGSFAVGSAVRARVEGAVVQLTFAAPVAKFLPMAAAAAAVLPEHTMRIHAEITEPDGSLRSVMGPLAGFRNYGNLDVETVDGLLTFVRICSTLAVDGRPWFSPEEWAGLAARVITLSEGLPLAARLGPARELRALAKAAGATRAVDACTAWMRQVRLSADT